MFVVELLALLPEHKEHYDAVTGKPFGVGNYGTRRCGSRGIEQSVCLVRARLAGLPCGAMNASRIQVVEGDITQLEVDAIVNAANTSLLGGGGVDGAIHRAAGPQLLEECRKLGGCPTGEARLTRGYQLPAKWVIHTPGPVWHGGRHGEDDQLAACYRHSLDLAAQQGARSVAFPAISTGVYSFPLERATRIALRETRAFLARNKAVERVVFVCFGHEALECYQRVVKETPE
jgi:O-acetyl-ADP-ribose deacetylase